jgi:hypothetical protein
MTLLSFATPRFSVAAGSPPLALECGMVNTGLISTAGAPFGTIEVSGPCEGRTTSGIFIPVKCVSLGGIA